MSLAELSVIISILALLLSGLTAWLTLLQRGTLQMTRPTFVGFVRESGGEPKIFLRALLYATGKRGYIVEGLYLSVRHEKEEFCQIFSFWTVRQEGRMAIGGGLKVDEDGISADFHFLPPKDEHGFAFLAGGYEIAVFAQIAGNTSSMVLALFKLSLSDGQARAMKTNSRNSVFFTWHPHLEEYQGYVAAAPVREFFDPGLSSLK
jgi:hypothetical protein